MCLRSYSIGGLARGAAPLNSVSRTALTVFSLGLALGVVLPREAFAGSGVVSPVQTSIYVLGALNPITFGAATQSIHRRSPGSMAFQQELVCCQLRQHPGTRGN